MARNKPGPPWANWNSELRGWVLQPLRVAAVRRIFELAASGKGSPTIAKTLNDEGTMTFGADEWTAGLVSAVLKNSAAHGEYDTGSRPALPPLLTKADFDNVQREIANRAGKGGARDGEVPNLFAGICYCECGAGLRYVGGDIPYLRCKSAYYNEGCNAEALDYEHFESFFRYLSSFISWSFVLEEVHIDETHVAISLIEAKKQKIDSWSTQFEQGSPTAATRILQLEKEIEYLKKAIQDKGRPEWIQELKKFRSLNATRKLDADISKNWGELPEPPNFVKNAALESDKKELEQIRDKLTSQDQEENTVGVHLYTTRRMRMQAGIARVVSKMTLTKNLSLDREDDRARTVIIEGDWASQLNRYFLRQIHYVKETYALLLANDRNLEGILSPENFSKELVTLWYPAGPNVAVFNVFSRDENFKVGQIRARRRK